jgi:hypothetical protein
MKSMVISMLSRVRGEMSAIPYFGAVLSIARPHEGMNPFGEEGRWT